MNQVHVVTANIGALNNDDRPLFKCPTGYGGITVVAANVYMGGAGTVALNVVNLGSAGTAVGGTIATLGSSVYVAHVPKAFTVATTSAANFVDEGEWVGVGETNVGTCNAITRVDIEYVVGHV